MRKKRVAVVGGGAAGLVAAWLLGRRHDVVLFEAKSRLGGHVRTVPLRDRGRTLRLDTGFIVFNRRTYPVFSRIIDRLSLPTRGTEMSFSLRCRGCGIEYGGRNLAGMLARPSSVLEPRFRRLLAGFYRFAREGRRFLRNGRSSRTSVDEFLSDSGLGGSFADHYLLPMASALWSAPLEEVRRFPARFLLTFFDSHGLLRLTDRPRWETVVGGSMRYVRRLTDDSAARFLTGCPVDGLHPSGGGVILRLADGRTESFDRAVVATHADQALALLSEPTREQREVLSAWSYTESDAWLHSDQSFLPDRRRARCSWNYRLTGCGDDGGRPRVTYHLNRLQRIDGDRAYLVTLNPSIRPRPDQAHDRFRFRHPSYGAAAEGAGEALKEMSGTAGVHFCGAYAGDGFHEAAVSSGVRAAGELGVALP